MRAVCDNPSVSGWESARANLAASHILPFSFDDLPAPTGLPHGYQHLVLGARLFPGGWDLAVFPLFGFFLHYLDRPRFLCCGRGVYTRLLSINLRILCIWKEPRDGVELR